MSQKFQDLESVFHKYDLDIENIAYLAIGDGLNSSNEDLDEEEVEEELGDIEVMEEVGGYEDGGNLMTKTIYFKKFDCYVFIKGHYSSWGDSEWQFMEEVFPRRAIMTVYENLKTRSNKTDEA